MAKVNIIPAIQPPPVPVVEDTVVLEMTRTEALMLLALTGAMSQTRDVNSTPIYDALHDELGQAFGPFELVSWKNSFRLVRRPEDDWCREQ